MSRKSKGKGKSGVWSEAEWTEWNAKRESHTNPKKTLDSLVKCLGEPGKAHRTFLEVILADGANETKSKPAPVKKTSNNAKAKQMSETERTAQVQALEKARDALGDCRELEGQKVYLTKEIENLRKLKLDPNLGVEIERETARLVSLEESRVRLITELSQGQQQLDTQKKELEELCKAMATDTELPDMAVDGEGLGAGPAVDNSLLQEVEVLRVILQQMSNPDPVRETQESLLRKHKVVLDSIQVKRQMTQG